VHAPDLLARVTRSQLHAHTRHMKTSKRGDMAEFSTAKKQFPLDVTMKLGPKPCHVALKSRPRGVGNKGAKPLREIGPLRQFARLDWTA
jgi:hypothetical protein